jgi:hypothetical protein
MMGNTAVVVGSHQVAGKEPRVLGEQLHDVVYTLVPASDCLAKCVEVVMIDHKAVCQLKASRGQLRASSTAQVG